MYARGSILRTDPRLELSASFRHATVIDPAMIAGNTQLLTVRYGWRSARTELAAHKYHTTTSILIQRTGQPRSSDV